MDRTRLRVPAALGATAAVAQVAVALLRPRTGVIDPDPVSARSYFSAAELERARAYRRPQLALGLASTLLDAAVLAWLAERGGWAPRAPRPAAAAAAGAALSLSLGAVGLPLAAIAHRRAGDVGLSTQTARSWLADQGRAAAVGMVLAGSGSALLVGLQRRCPRRWWAPAALAAWLAGGAFLALAPVLLDPLFNRFTPLPEGPARDDVLRLAREAGVDVGEVYEVDASRRTTAANAYVTGLGATKRVVLFDTLLRDFSRDEVALVVAHELAHVRYRDVPRGLLLLALVAPPALLAIQRATEALAPGRTGTPAMLPALALAAGPASAVVTTVSNQLSRRIEARADSYALELTGAPEPFIAMERRLALSNLAEPDPPAWRTAVLATHPPTVRRIGTALAFARGARGQACGERASVRSRSTRPSPGTRAGS